MKKKDKLKDKKSTKSGPEQEDLITSNLDNKFEFTDKIDELRNLAQNSYLNGDYKEAIGYAEEIIKLAVQRNITSYVKDQENFINIIADKLQKEYLISEIENVAIGIQRIHETLLKTNKVEKAHQIFEDFKNKYHEFPEFKSITLVQELIAKDTKEWIKFKTSMKENVKEDEEEDDIDATVDEIQKFLNIR
jgi:uncharacterized Zn ribbon protein